MAIQRGAKLAPTKTETKAAHEMSLADRLAASIKIADKHASAQGEEVAPPPSPEEEIIPDLAEVLPDRAARLKLIRLIEEEAPLAEQERVVLKARKNLKDAIKSILGKFHIGKAMHQGYRINYYAAGSRASIDAKKLTIALMTEGLKTDRVNAIIDAATTIGKPSWTLKITPPGGNDEGGE